MEIPVLIEPMPGNGYRARGCEPFALAAEGSTRDEALGRLRVLLAGRLAAGVEIVPLEVAPARPWARFAGQLNPADPLVQEWKQAMDQRRHQEDEPDAS